MTYNVFSGTLNPTQSVKPKRHVRRGSSSPFPKRGRALQFSAHVYCGQTATWIKMPLGMDRSQVIKSTWKMQIVCKCLFTKGVQNVHYLHGHMQHWRRFQLDRIAVGLFRRRSLYCYRRSSVVCLSLTIVSPAKTTEPIEMPFWDMNSGWRKKAWWGVQIHARRNNFEGEKGIAHSDSDRSDDRYILKATQQGADRRNGTADADWSVLHGGAQWRNLANTTESPVCSGDAALCQITLTTCYLFKCRQRSILCWLHVWLPFLQHQSINCTYMMNPNGVK